MIWQHTVPKPCTAEDLDKIQTWLDSREVLTKEEVMLDTFGYTDERSANRAVSFQVFACVGCLVARRAASMLNTLGWGFLLECLLRTPIDVFGSNMLLNNMSCTWACLWCREVVSASCLQLRHLQASQWLLLREWCSVHLSVCLHA